MKKTLIQIHIALAILALHLAPIAAAGPLDTWSWRNPEPTGSYLSGVANGVVNGNSQFVAVGYNSIILTSPDGTNWVQQTVTNNLTLTGIAFNGTNFVAVGLDATTSAAVVSTSADGTNWLTMDGTLGSHGLLAVTSGSGEFVAVGYGGAVLTSPDGTNWAPQASGVGNTLNAVAYGDNLFVAVGSSGGIFTSPDSTNWTSRISGTSYALAGVAYGNGTFAVVGQSVFLQSFNGIAWGVVLTGYFSVAVTYDTNDSLFVAWDNDEQPGLFTSSNSLSWKINGPATARTTALFNAVTYNDNNKMFVAVGSGGAIATSTSTYGTNWYTQGSFITSEPLDSVAYGSLNLEGGESVFVVGGGTFGGSSGTMILSLDGTNWYQGTLNANVSYGTTVSGITYGQDLSGNSLFVAVGSSYNSFENGVILTNYDGVHWGQSFINSQGFNTLNAVTYASGKTPSFVAVGGNGVILTSSDAVAWTTQTSHTNSTLYGVTYGDGLFVTVGAGGAIVESPDAVNWSASSVKAGELYGIAYGNKMFVAVGESSSFYPLIMTSPDGVTWSSAYTNDIPDAYLTDVTFNNGTFVVTGLSGQILTSPDGISWTSRNTGTMNQLNAVVFGDHQFIAVGASGTILGTGPQPPPILVQLSPPVIDPTTGTIQFSLTGPAGSPVNLQSSIGDLSHFITTQSTTFDSSGNASFSGTVAPSTAIMFYRLQIP
jgi:hypothetical protein